MPFTALAQSTFYWDRNGSPAGAGSTAAVLSGTWDTSTANWNDTSTGSNSTETFVSGSNAVFSAGTSALGVTFTVTVSGTQNANSINVEEGMITFSGGTINLVGPNFTVASGLTTTVNSVVSGSNGLIKDGAGTLLLAGTNTFTGGTTLSAGALALGNNNALGSGALTVGDGTTISASGGSRAIANNVNVAGDFTIGGSQALTLNGTVNLGGGTRTITVNNTATTTIAGSITEPYYSGLTKAGSGELVLSGNNSFTAPVTVSSGTLTLANSNALGASGTSNNTVSSGATLALQNNITVNEASTSIAGTGVGGNGAIRNVSGNNTYGGTINVDGAASIVSTAGSATFTGNLAVSNNLTLGGAGDMTFSGGGYGGGDITKTGSGTVTISGTTSTSWSGAVNVNDGTVVLAKTGGASAGAPSTLNIGDGSGAANSAVVRLGASDQIADYAGLITVKSDGQLNLNGFSEKVNTITSTGTLALGTGSLTVGVNSGSSSLGGSITGAGTLIKEGSGTLALLSSIVLAGELQLNAGTLALGGYNLTANTLHITGNSVIDFGGGNSTLNLTNFIIDAGVTLTVQNWTAAADYFYTQGWTGASFGTSGSAPMNQVIFAGYGGNNTHWQSYDKQITPVPEPSTYGLLMLLGAGGFAAWRRRNR